MLYQRDYLQQCHRISYCDACHFIRNLLEDLPQQIFSPACSLKISLYHPVERCAPERLVVFAENWR